MWERRADLPRVHQRLRADPLRRRRCCATCPTRSRRCARACRRPPAPKQLADIVEWLGELVRQVDSSLLDEWEQLTSPDQEAGVPVQEIRAVPARPRPLTGQRAGVHRDGPQRVVPPGGVVRPVPLGRARGARRRVRLDGRALGRRGRGVLRRTRGGGYRSRRPWPGVADLRPAAAGVAEFDRSSKILPEITIGASTWKSTWLPAMRKVPRCCVSWTWAGWGERLLNPILSRTPGLAARPR